MSPAIVWHAPYTLGVRGLGINATRQRNASRHLHSAASRGQFLVHTFAVADVCNVAETLSMRELFMVAQRDQQIFRAHIHKLREPCACWLLSNCYTALGHHRIIYTTYALHDVDR